MKSHVTLLRYGILVLLACTSFLAMYVSTSMFFPYITGKNFAFRTLIELALVLYIPLAYCEPKYRPQKSKGILLYTAFIAALLLADIFGVNPMNSFFSNFERMEGFITHIHLFVFTALLIFIRLSKEEWQRMFQIYIVGNMLALVFAISEALSISNKLSLGEQVGTRVAGTLGNPAYLAIYTIFGIFFATLLLIQRKNTARDFEKFLYYIVIISNVWVLWKTETRGTVLGLVAGLGVSMVLYVIKPYIDSNKKQLVRAGGIGAIVGILLSRFLEDSNALISLCILLISSYVGVLVYIVYQVYKKQQSKHHTIITSIIAVGTALVILFPFVSGTGFVQNTPTLKRIADINLEEQTVRSRFMIWGMSIEGVKERPLLGWGQDNFIYVFSKHYNPEMFDQEQWFDRSHNVFLDWLIAGGVIVLALYLSLFAVVIWYVLINKNKRFEKGEQTVIIAVLITYFVHNIFVFDNLISYIGFFTLFAYVVSTSMPTKGGTKHTQTVSPVVAASVLAVSVIIVGYVWYTTTYIPKKLNSNIIKMYSVNSLDRNSLDTIMDGLIMNSPFGGGEAREQLLNFVITILGSKAADVDKQYFVMKTHSVINKEIDKDPENPRPVVLYAGYLSHIGLYKESVNYYEKALASTPNKTLLWLELADEDVKAGDVQMAIRSAEKAHVLAPRSIQVTQALGTLYYLVGDKESVHRIWTETVAANKNSSEVYIQQMRFYKEAKDQQMLTVSANELKSKYPEISNEIDQYLAEGLQ